MAVVTKTSTRRDPKKSISPTVSPKWPMHPSLSLSVSKPHQIKLMRGMRMGNSGLFQNLFKNPYSCQSTSASTKS
eukprot:CAMPEP_0170455710 /NCGR_PEP_ID=MMETSP0123-20130129/3579_1 /TAXON_ID=182087 /ORGANISM="Favella ehrenbergii, Strain Fehren 1" /LENGTH=74 /DNA_ID=CAMNT_0010718929 /DNA_START=28 /DNA_END=252 /DNA_ORIENTATION=-